VVQWRLIEDEATMVISLPPQLESALADQSRQRGIAPEALALDILRRHLAPVAPPVPTDEWERRLLGAATDCGVSLSDEALSREALYD
jgi:hypothetical protein